MPYTYPPPFPLSSAFPFLILCHFLLYRQSYPYKSILSIVENYFRSTFVYDNDILSGVYLWTSEYVYIYILYVVHFCTAGNTFESTSVFSRKYFWSTFVYRRKWCTYSVKYFLSFKKILNGVLLSSGKYFPEYFCFWRKTISGILLPQQEVFSGLLLCEAGNTPWSIFVYRTEYFTEYFCMAEMTFRNNFGSDMKWFAVCFLSVVGNTVRNNFVHRGKQLSEYFFSISENTSRGTFIYSRKYFPNCFCLSWKILFGVILSSVRNTFRNTFICMKKYFYL